MARRKRDARTRFFDTALGILFVAWLITSSMTYQAFGEIAFYAVTALFIVGGIYVIWRLNKIVVVSTPHGRTQARPHIPQRVKEAVWRRDGGRCVYCGSNAGLEFDHVIPHTQKGEQTR